MIDFSAKLDPGSLAELVRLQGFGVLLNPNIQEALIETGTLLVNAAVANTWAVFTNPTGTLANSIYFWVAGPMEVDVAVGVPYGRRQELGGGDLLDSLGRVMTNPARPYLQPAVDDNQEAIRELMRQAVLKTITEVGG